MVEEPDLSKEPQDDGDNSPSYDQDEREAKRKALKEFLTRTEPVWNEEDHPDIAAMGAAEWVRALRREKSDRQRWLEEWYDRK
jgi:hypothetical protein